MFNKENPIGKATLRASGAVTGGRFVGYNGAQLASAGADAYGVAEYDAADGTLFSAVIEGSVTTTAGAAITQYAEVATSAAGKAITAVSTNVILGRALTAATADGQNIEVALNTAKPVKA